jgi:hypothetical protein
MGKTMAMVILERPRTDHGARDSRYKQHNYKRAAPFFENPRGVLIHRVRALYRLTATYSGAPWWIVEYWCENHGRTDDADSGLLFDPGEKLVCARCEALAVSKGRRTSSDLAGRHVCTGVCRPVNTCCHAIVGQPKTR